MDQTPSLNLPLLQPAQASKHITVNEGLLAIDMVSQLRLSGRDMTTPPPNRLVGACYASGAVPTGDWAGHAHHLILDLGTDWRFMPLHPGYCGFDLSSLEHIVWTGGAWQSTALSLTHVTKLGIGTQAASGQALTVEGGSSLFTADTGDIRQTLNKTASGDVGSLLFQSGFQTQAEVGLIGDDRLTVRMVNETAQSREHLSISADEAGIRSDAFRSGTITVASQDIATISTPRSSGILAIITTHANYPQVFHSGLFAFDSGTSPLLMTLVHQYGLSNQGVADLGVTPGPDALTSLSVGLDYIQIGNRYNTTQTYSWTFLC